MGESLAKDRAPTRDMPLENLDRYTTGAFRVKDVVSDAQLFSKASLASQAKGVPCSCRRSATEVISTIDR